MVGRCLRCNLGILPLGDTTGEVSYPKGNWREPRCADFPRLGTVEVEARQHHGRCSAASGDCGGGVVEGVMHPQNKAHREQIKHRKGLRRCLLYGVTPTPRHIRRFGEDGVNCSCWMCGNPRRHHGNSSSSKTIQERRLD